MNISWISIRRHIANVSMILLLAMTSGCAFNVTRYTDGPLTDYLAQPVPRLDRPIARTVSLEKVMFQTAASMEATMISDMVAREIYFLPEEVGEQVKRELQLDRHYDAAATYKALNTVARNRAQARHMWDGETAPVPTVTANTSQSTVTYVRRQESMAKAAYDKGDYLAGDIHNSAATNALMIDQSFSQAQATVTTGFAVLNAMAAAGEALIKDDFIRLRNWIVSESGAIGDQAPAGNHLSVFFLQFFDAESFQLDSRNRVAVFLVITDHDGNSISVLEGSDILNCEGECNLFQPRPTAQVFDKQYHSADVQQQLWTPEGFQYLNDNGFDPVSGIYQYFLLQHGLRKLSAQIR